MTRTHDRGAEALAAEAFAIADSTMKEQLLCHCLRTNHHDQLLLCGEDGQRVDTIDAADSAVREAFSWLSRRGLARLDRSGAQAMIVLDARQRHAR